MASSWEPLATCRVQRTLLEDREWEGGWGVHGNSLLLMAKWQFLLKSHSKRWWIVCEWLQTLHVDSTTRFLSAFHPQHHHHCYHPHHRHRRYHQHQNHHCHHHHPHLDDYIMMVPMHARQIKDQHSSVLSASQPVFGRQWQTHIDNSSSSSYKSFYKLIKHQMVM